MRFASVAVVVLSLVGSVPGMAGERLEARGMEAAFEVEGDWLRVELAADTTGWVAIGFNDRPELAGSRLFMARVSDGVTVVEEHIADPPNHERRPGSELDIDRVEGEEARGATRVRFRVKLAKEARVPLVAGRNYHVTLAWSVEDDFGHHSAMRTAVDAKLAARP